MKQSAAIALVLAACRAPLAEGSGARIDAGPIHGPKIAEIVKEVEPRIIEILGTRWEREYDVTIKYGDFVGQTRDWDRKVTVGALALVSDGLPLTLAHELTHVHMLGAWRDLPPVLQEGVAIWVSLLVLDRTDEFVGPPPARQLCIDVLTLSYSYYRHAEKPRQDELNYAATWLAARFMSPGLVATRTNLRSSLYCVCPSGD